MKNHTGTLFTDFHTDWMEVNAFLSHLQITDCIHLDVCVILVVVSGHYIHLTPWECLSDVQI